MENQDNITALAVSDEDIIELYWKRDEDAILQTDKKYRNYLFTIAYNVLRDRYESDECLNDTYMSVWNKIPPERPNYFRAFISKITRGVSIDKYRMKNAAKRIPTEMTVSLDELDECVTLGDSSDEDALIMSVAEVMNRYLATLSTNDAFVFICRYYYFDRVEEIANMMGVSVGAVYKRLTKMRDALREILVKEGICDERK